MYKGGEGDVDTVLGKTSTSWGEAWLGFNAGNENKHLFLTAGKCERLILLQKAQQPPASGAEKYSPQPRGKTTSHFYQLLCADSMHSEMHCRNHCLL